MRPLTFNLCETYSTSASCDLFNASKMASHFYRAGPIRVLINLALFRICHKGVVLSYFIGKKAL